MNSEGNRALRLVDQPANRRYLEDARGRLQRLEAPIRNPRTTTPVDLHVSNENGETFELHVPDVAGDLYQDYWETREWSLEFDELARSINGVMLFLHALKVATPVSLDDIAELAAAAGGGGATAPDQSSGTWDSSLAPDQVKVVDVLQMLEARHGSPIGQVPVAVVVSAWDRVKGMDPPEWLRRSAPLVDQYLETSSFWTPCSVFGVSAQGGDLKDDRDKLIDIRPSDRVKVVTAAGAEHDITIPIRRLIGRD
jgi:hypothetical protein